MKNALSIWVLFVATGAFGGERMSVSVCNMNGLPEPAIRHAEDEAAYVFRAMGVEINWIGCGAEVGAEDARIRPDFIVRVRTGGRIAKAGPVSLEAMGRAFMDSTGYGFMVDTYYGAIRDLTLLFPFAGSDQVLGYTIAHELGHLLIGAGHRANGIMRAAWSKAELEALNRRHLRFNDWERAVIIHKLQMRDAATAAAHPAEFGG